MRPLAAASQWMFIVDSGWALDDCCYFLVGSGWLLLFPGGLWMVAVVSWWALDSSCYFLVGKHADIKKTKKAKLKKLQTPGFEPKTLRIRS